MANCFFSHELARGQDVKRKKRWYVTHNTLSAEVALMLEHEFMNTIFTQNTYRFLFSHNNKLHSRRMYEQNTNYIIGQIKGDSSQQKGSQRSIEIFLRWIQTKEKKVVQG